VNTCQTFASASKFDPDPFIDVLGEIEDGLSLWLVHGRLGTLWSATVPASEDARASSPASRCTASLMTHNQHYEGKDTFGMTDSF
jgi:hypothetical protein